MYAYNIHIHICIYSFCEYIFNLIHHRFDGVSSRKIVVLPNSSVAAWHPEPSFPYEQTKPLPEKTIEDQLLIRDLAGCRRELRRYFASPMK
ncbi:hypothetical protein DICVIV_14455 [Dictyocaulus viviparus]|uniref:Uncharacterized protein n=1 Tax=Dictyocaulus viviparus TaxID=29172 RepID=A0A0D8X585_DICVI|nr:hypothetical protein DICVIV_14455 [Dictyocaulus viviparus]